MELSKIGGAGDEKTTEQRIQDEIAGDDILVSIYKFIFIFIAQICYPRIFRAIHGRSRKKILH